MAQNLPLGKVYLDENQWFDDPFHTLIIRFPNPQAINKSEYKVQSYMFQLKSGFFHKKLEEVGEEIPTKITLPNTFNHSAYEDLHKEILGYAVEFKHDLSQDYYYISCVLELENKKRFIQNIIHTLDNGKDKLWEIYKIACDLSDEELKESLIFYLDGRGFHPMNFLLAGEGEKKAIREYLRGIEEENFKNLIKIHNKQKLHSDKRDKGEYLSQKTLFELCREYCQANYGDQGVKKKLRELSKKVINFCDMEFEDFQQISREEIFTEEEENALMQQMNQKDFLLLRADNQEFKKIIPNLKEEMNSIENQAKFLDSTRTPKVFALFADFFEVVGINQLKILETVLPLGKYEVLVSFFAKKGGNNPQSQFWMTLYFNLNGVKLPYIPNDGWNGYNSTANISSPFILRAIFENKNENAKFDFSGLSNGNDIRMDKISMVIREIAE